VKKISVAELYDFLLRDGKLTANTFVPLTDELGFDREIQTMGINRPGLTLTGIYEFFVQERIQVFGRGEIFFLNSLNQQRLQETVDKFFQFKVPCCFVTHNSDLPGYFLEVAKEKKTPIIRTSYNTSEFVNLVTRILNEVLSPTVTIHGGLLEVYGTGILIIGKSGVGKSECALELLERGHRLVADDVVELSCIRQSMIMGTSAEHIKYVMEIRGLGIINVRDLFGIGSVRNDKVVEVVVELEEWDSQKEYDRLGLDESTFEILGVKIPLIVIPVRPGRNIPILIEVAAMNTRLKKMDYHPAREYNKNLKKWIKEKQIADQKGKLI
jgi:HPr kinase/phosphorylase